jgi:hypothetical protein
MRTSAQAIAASADRTHTFDAGPSCPVPEFGPDRYLFRNGDSVDVQPRFRIVCLAVIRTASEMCLLIKHETHEHLRMATAPSVIEAVLHQQDQERDLVASGWTLSGVQGLSPGGLVAA